MNEEQDVVSGKTSPGEHFGCEEVGTCQDGHVRGDEISPGGILTPLGCRLDAVAAKVVADRLIGNGMAEVSHAPTMRSCPTTGVLSGEADNERFQFGRDAGPSRRST